jgi:hypothetical protein
LVEVSKKIAGIRVVSKWAPDQTRQIFGQHFQQKIVFKGNTIPSLLCEHIHTSAAKPKPTTATTVMILRIGKVFELF